MPSRKVGAGALAGAMSVIIVWAAESFSGIKIPAEVSSAFTVVLMFGVSYVVVEP